MKPSAEAAPEMKRRLIVIRHAPTLHNEAGVFMGRADGQCRATALAEAGRCWDGRPPPAAEGLFSSPLGRCVATAAAILPGRKARRDARLAERDLGAWSGREKEAVVRAHPEAYLAGGPLDPRVTPPGGEDFSVFLGRIEGFLAEIAGDVRAPETLVLVTHNGVIRALRHLLEGRPLLEVFSQPEPHLTPREFGIDREILGRAAELARQR